MKISMHGMLLLAMILTLRSTVLWGQDKPDENQKPEPYKIQAYVGIQLWSTYTFGQEIYDTNEEAYHKVDNRFNLQIRRTRFGIKAQPYQNLKFRVTAALDLVGRDVLSGTQAGANNGPSPQFRLWEAYTQWRILNDREYLNLTAGYIPPQIGRESITSALRSTSMEKAWTQNYLRRHLTGIGPGRAPGINIGGLIAGKDHAIGWRYDIGIYTPVFEAFDGNSTGSLFAPLMTGRFALSFGDPESREYSIHHKINYFGARKGLTIAIAGATQGATDLFASNNAFGVDILFNWGNLNIDGDWTRMTRSRVQGIDDQKAMTIQSSAGYLRMSYNIALKKGYIIEPLLMYSLFEGGKSAAAQAFANQVKSPCGRDEAFDVGVNLYFNPDLRLALHYTMQDGDPGAAGNGAEVNNYFAQNGAIQRGDWLGLGLVAIF